MTQLFPAFAAGWLLTAALLVIEHLLWKNTPIVVRYMLGAGTICTGCSLAGAVLDNAVLAFGPWVVGSAGLLVVLMYWHDERAATAAKSAAKRGEIVGATKGLTQELIDRGSDRSRNQN